MYNSFSISLLILLFSVFKENLTKWLVRVDISQSVQKWTHILLIGLSPPHLCLLPPRHSPDCSTERLLSGVCLFRLSVPPRGQWGWSGWSAAAGGAVFCGHQDWRIGRLQSLPWPTQAPSRDGIPAYDDPQSRSAWLESQEPRCLSGMELFLLERERLEHCGGLKQ